jgi:hypothetical protein
MTILYIIYFSFCILLFSNLLVLQIADCRLVSYAACSRVNLGLANRLRRRLVCPDL